MAKKIEEGDQVLLRRDSRSMVFQVKCGRQLHFEKAKFTLDGVIGEPFGATFKVVDGEMVRIGDPDEVLNEMMETDAQASGSGKDNRDLVAARTNQKLSQEDILKMKEEGESGEKIIQELISNSETFGNKTEYSQRKYLKKKLKKHVFIFTVLKPTARLLIEMVYTKSPDKICNLRIDSLSQILTYANIMSGVNVAIVDTLQGIVVGSVMERMGGLGKVVQFYPGSDANRHVLNFFDFPKEFIDNLYSFPLKNLQRLKLHETKKTQEVNKVSECEDNSKMEVDQKGDNSESANGLVEGNSEDKPVDTNGSDQQKECGPNKHKGDNSQDEDKRIEKAKIQEFVKSFILQREFDSLIVACKYHPTPIVLALLEFVSPSRPVVVYSAHKEPLLDCYSCLKEGGSVINLRLTETWYREYQVLPGQTHPTMQMTGTGGYLLTCTTVAS